MPRVGTLKPGQRFQLSGGKQGVVLSHSPGGTQVRYLKSKLTRFITKKDGGRAKEVTFSAATTSLTISSYSEVTLIDKGK